MQLSVRGKWGNSARGKPASSRPALTTISTKSPQDPSPRRQIKVSPKCTFWSFITGQLSAPKCHVRNGIMICCGIYVMRP